MDYGNISYAADFIQDLLEKRIKFTSKFFQCRAVRTSEDLYACYPSGIELYYRLPDEENDRINDSIYKNRVEYLKGLCGEDWIDLNIESRFVAGLFMKEVMDALSNEYRRY